MQSKNLPYTLGVDIGIASTGAALLLDDSILGLHVRTFDKAETSDKGDSLNKIRREARLTRRRLRRRAHRLLRLCRLFKRIGLIDAATPADFALPISTWSLRADALDRRLNDREWASVLYHIVKHRGFQSNRKSEVKTDEKAGQMLNGVTRNQQLLSEGGFRSVGELAARHPDFSRAKRNKGGCYNHTFARADLQHELQLLFQRQRELGNAYADSEFERQMVTLLLARKPTMAGDALLKMLGHCSFETDQYRAPKASYRAERFVWLGKLNNLKIVSYGESRSLSEGERQQIIELPFQKSKLTFKQVRKALDLAPQQHFNLLSYRSTSDKNKDPEDTALFEAKAFHTLRKAYEEAGLKQQWQRDSLDADRLDTLAYALSVYKDDTASRVWLQQQGVEDEIIDAVLLESFDKFIQLSQKALSKILPFMEQGQRYDQAAESAGYQHSQPKAAAENRGYLPPPDRDVIRNPVVYRALNQARKLINAIVREYGPPKAVHIEMARDLSKPFDERKKIERQQKDYQVNKQQAAERFSDEIGRAPSGNELLKMRLYHEQDSQCPYCQQALDINRLYDAHDIYAQIDHALPFSRSFDDSLSNKVLVHTQCNQNKSNQTPFEFFGNHPENPAWQRFRAWVHANPKISPAKRNRLLRMNFGDREAREFRDRNLNDTRYIARELKQMIERHLQWHPQAEGKERCVVLSGQLTALLRARWGLAKDRENGDLHHVQDAAVIAAASRSLVKRMSDYARRKELAMVRGDYLDPETGEVLDIDAVRLLEQHFPQPWPWFRQELQARLSNNPSEQLAKVSSYLGSLEFPPVRVSRAPTRRGLGAAHQETIRSIRGEELSAVKTPLTSLKIVKQDDWDKLKPNIVGYERDTALIAAISERLQEYAYDGKKAFAQPLYKPSRDGRNAPLIRGVTLAGVQKSGLPVRGGIASNDSMVRADIFSKNGKFYVVPVYVADAVREELPNRAVVASKPEVEWPVMDDLYQFLFSLYPNDWLTVRLKGEIREGYFSGLDRSTGAISLWLHDRNQMLVKQGLQRSIGIKTALALEKYHVDLLGNLHRVHQETRQSVHLPKKRKP